MIQLHWLEWLPVALYLLITLIIGFYNRDDSASEEHFILGGRQLTLPAFVMTLVTTWYGGILGVGEFTYLYGLANWVVFGLPYYLFAILFALFIADKIQQSRLFTIPDQFFTHYGKTAGFLATGVAFLITLPAPYILMIGFLVHLVTGWSLTLSVVVGTIFSTVYVLTGGFRAVVRTDKLQFILMYGGFLLMLVVLISRYGGFHFLAERLPPTHLNPTGNISPWVLLSWFLIALWTFIDPGFYQRCYAARSPRVARKGILISVAFWFLFDALTTTVGLYARALLPDVQPVLSYPWLSHTLLPPLASGIFFTALFATIMSTTDSYTLLGAITFGHDVLARIPRFAQTSRVRLLRVGLVFTAGLSILLALVIPSVVQLWYVIGSICIPPLLLPLLAVHYPTLPWSPRSTVVNLIGAFGLSAGWLVAGWAMASASSNFAYPWGIQPMFPGLLFSILVAAYNFMRR